MLICYLCGAVNNTGGLPSEAYLRHAGEWGIGIFYRYLITDGIRGKKCGNAHEMCDFARNPVGGIFYIDLYISDLKFWHDF